MSADAPAGAPMRVVVFTGNPALESTRAWRALLAMPRLGEVLVVRRLVAPGIRPLLRRLRGNIRRHGILFVPYRIAMVGIGLLERLRGPAPFGEPDPVPAVPVRVLEVLDIHAPPVLESVRAFAPELGVSLGAPILRASLFGIPTLGTINMHLGKVPDFRGAPPGFWELHEGATEIGATIHWMNEGLDTGPVIHQATAPIHPRDSLEDVEERAAELGEILLRRALVEVSHGVAAAAPQPAGGGRTFRMPTLGVRMRFNLERLGQVFRRTILSPGWIAKASAALGFLALLRPPRDLMRTVLARHPVRFFNYHRVTELCRDGMTISPRAFRAQVAYLRRTHDIVSLERALLLLRTKERLRRPVAVITFDDAYASVFESAAPILERAGVPATVFVCPDLVGTGRRFAHDAMHPMREHFPCMGWQELLALRRAGWSIGAHTANHVRLSAVVGAELDDELRRPMRELRDRLGLSEVALAYPFGQRTDISPEALVLARSLGYTAVLSDFGGDARGPESDEWQWRRWDIGGDHPTLSWRTQVHGVDLTRFRHLVPDGGLRAG